MDKPNRKEWPDYYKRILEPIDMRTIERKIKGDKYPKIEDLLEDFYLMFENARYFNEPGSQVRLLSTLRLSKANRNRVCLVILEKTS